MPAGGGGRAGASRPRGPGTPVWKTEPHEVAAGGYLVLTDHVDPVARKALDRLAAYRGGQVLAIDDLGRVARDGKARDALRDRIRADMPRFLVASLPKSLAALVDRWIADRPVATKDFRAFAIAEIPPDLLYKSFESSGLLKKLFAARGVTMGDLTIPANEEVSSRSDYPEIRDEGRFAIRKSRWRDLLDAFPTEVQAAIEDAAFVWILGRGTPGMACCARVSAYTDMDLENKPHFGLKAIDDGSVIVLGNMGVSQGVHLMLPIVEGCLEGLSIGEAFQRMMNAHLGTEGFAGGYITRPLRGGRRNVDPRVRRAAQLINVLIGDPAIRPFAGLTGSSAGSRSSGRPPPASPRRPAPAIRTWNRPKRRAGGPPRRGRAAS